MRNALIAGATGAIGSVLLELLNDSDSYSEIHCIGRREPSTAGEKIMVHLVDFDELDQLNFQHPVDDVFCTLGTTIKAAGSKDNFRKVDRDYVHQLGRLAQRLQTKTFTMVSAVGANAESSSFYNRTKGEAEELLQGLELPSLRIFRPSLLHGDREEFRLMETAGYVLITLMTPLLLGRLKKYRSIHIKQVAKAMYLSAQQDFPRVRFFESDEIQLFQ